MLLYTLILISCPHLYLSLTYHSSSYFSTSSFSDKGQGALLIQQHHSTIARRKSISISSSRSSSDANGSNKKKASLEIYGIRNAEQTDLGPISQIITKGFYAKRTNFITFQFERLNTFLSLDSTFPYRKKSILYNDDPLQLHHMFVAENSKRQIIGFIELECRGVEKEGNNSPLSSSTTLFDGDTSNSNNSRRDGEKQQQQQQQANDDPPPRPYMFNLVVDEKYQNNGIGTSLIKHCEQFVIKNINVRKKRLFLKVRDTNNVAMKLYANKLKYQIVSSEIPSSGYNEGNTICLLSKDLGLDNMISSSSSLISNSSRSSEEKKMNGV